MWHTILWLCMADPTKHDIMLLSVTGHDLTRYHKINYTVTRAFAWLSKYCWMCPYMLLSIHSGKLVQANDQWYRISTKLGYPCIPLNKGHCIYIWLIIYIWLMYMWNSIIKFNIFYNWFPFLFQVADIALDLFVVEVSGQLTRFYTQ